MRRVIFLFVLAIPIMAMAGFDINIEGGYAFCGYNDIQIPGDTGTKYSFCDDLDTTEIDYSEVLAGGKLNSLFLL